MRFKKIAATVLAAAVLAATPATVKLFSPFSVTASAEDTLTEGDWTYSVNEDGNTVTITKYNGSDTEVVIPTTLGGGRVTAIGEEAFLGCKSLTNVTIPDGVTTIGEDAFFSCSSLISVSIPDSVTTIGVGAFSCSSLISVSIPDSVTTIGNSAFMRCSSLTSVTIPNSVTSIEGWAFEGCDSLTSVTIPDSVTIIGSRAFGGCSLTSVTIPNSVTLITGAPFYGCSSLTSIVVDADNANYCSEDGILFNKDKSRIIEYPAGKNLTNYTIPGSVTTIGDQAFGGCSSLTSVEIPNSVTIIDSLAFNGCSSLTNIVVGEDNENYSSVDGVLFNKNKETLLCYPAGKEGAYEIPNSVTIIDLFAFNSCSSLTSVTIPNGITTIDAWLFNCSSLASVTIPDSVTTISDGVFGGCSSLNTVNYNGTKAEWAAIEIGELNDFLKNAKIICTDGTINGSGTVTPPPTTGETLTPATPVTPVTPSDTTSSETSSETTSSDTSAPKETVDKETGITVEVSKEDTDLIDADFTVDPANHGSLLDLIKKIVEKVADTVSEEVKKSLDEAAETVKNGKGFAYDMSFKKNGAEVQPDKKVTVTVPVPDEFKSDIDKLNVYHLTDKGAVFVPSWIKDGAVVFETDSFSPYVITVDKLANAVGEEQMSSAPDSSLNNNAPSDGVSNPYTGSVAVAFASIAALAAVTVAAVTKKKK